MNTPFLNILIANARADVRYRLHVISSRIPGVIVVGEAADGLSAVRLSMELQPDVVLVDALLPIMDGIEVVRHLRERVPSTRVLVVTSAQPIAFAVPALRAGASGYCAQECPAELLENAIRSVHAGAMWLDDRAATAVSKSLIGDRTAWCGARQTFSSAS